jgi:hypothetical protein
MHSFKFFVSAFLVFFNMGILCAQQNAGEASVWGHFIASTPCSIGTRPLPGIPMNQDCELMQWDLKLFEDRLKKTPSEFVLHYSFGMPLNNTHGMIGGGTSRELKGSWIVIQGNPSNRRAIIFRLVDSATGNIISLLKLNDDLLHLLDSEGHLMIGNAAWSYTLNKTSN